MTTRPEFYFRASWRNDPRDTSSAYLVGPQPGALGTTHPPYIALYVGGINGVRISIPGPDAAEQLAQLLTEAAARFRATAAAPNADDPDAWDHSDITIPDPDTDSAPETTGPADNAAAVPVPAAC